MSMMSRTIILSLQWCKDIDSNAFWYTFMLRLGASRYQDSRLLIRRGPKRNQSLTLLLQCPIHDGQNEPVYPSYLTGRVVMVLLKQDGIWVKPSAFEGRIVLKHGNVSILIIQRLFEPVRYSRYYMNLFSFTKGNWFSRHDRFLWGREVREKTVVGMHRMCRWWWVG